MSATDFYNKIGPRPDVIAAQDGRLGRYAVPAERAEQVVAAVNVADRERRPHGLR